MPEEKVQVWLKALFQFEFGHNQWSDLVSPCAFCFIIIIDSGLFETSESMSMKVFKSSGLGEVDIKSKELANRIKHVIPLEDTTILDYVELK